MTELSDLTQRKLTMSLDGSRVWPTEESTSNRVHPVTVPFLFLQILFSLPGSENRNIGRRPYIDSCSVALLPLLMTIILTSCKVLYDASQANTHVSRDSQFKVRVESKCLRDGFFAIETEY